MQRLYEEALCKIERKAQEEDIKEARKAQEEDIKEASQAQEEDIKEASKAQEEEIKDADVSKPYFFLIWLYIFGFPLGFVFCQFTRYQDKVTITAIFLFPLWL